MVYNISVCYFILHFFFFCFKMKEPNPNLTYKAFIPISEFFGIMSRGTRIHGKKNNRFDD